MNDALLQN